MPSQWPNVPCPPGGPTTAADILDYIVFKAAQDQATNLSQIIQLVGVCRANEHPIAMDDDAHCEYVLRAKFFADSGQWFRVANELNHGT